jgi:hypothetical protein
MLSDTLPNLQLFKVASGENMARVEENTVKGYLAK